MWDWNVNYDNIPEFWFLRINRTIVGLKYDNQLPVTINLAWGINRTIVGLKSLLLVYINLVVEGINRTIVGLKYVQIKCPSNSSGSINRTIVGLKWSPHCSSPERRNCINRTIVGLKSCIGNFQLLYQLLVLIEPLWDWNSDNIPLP